MNKRNTGFNVVPFLIVLAFLLGGIFASNAQSRNINLGLDHISIGYGPMSFPSLVAGGNPTQGGAAYLAIGGRNGGGMLFIGGDSQILGGERFGSGMVGLAGFRDFPIIERNLEFGIFAGVAGFQTYEAVDITPEGLATIDPFVRPQLRETNIQPYGGVRMVVFNTIEVQYAPVSNMITFGFKLYK